MKKYKDFFLSNKNLGYLITLLLISIPFPYAFSSIAMVLLFLFSLFSLLYHKVVFRKSLVIPICFFLWMALSLFWTIDIDKSIRGIIRQLPFLIVPLSFIFMPEITKKITHYILLKTTLFFTSFALILCLIAGYRYFQTGDLYVFKYHELVSPLNLNAIYVSVMVSIALLYALFYFKNKALKWTTGFILFVFLIFLSSKTVMFATLISVVIGRLVIIKFSWKQVFYTLGIVILATIIIYLSPLKDRIKQEFTANVEEVLTSKKFTKIYPWRGNTIRLFQARIGYEMLREDNKEWLGYGINASQNKILQKHKEYDIYKGFYQYNFHNQYIQSWAELGVVGVVFILSLLLLILKNYKNTNEVIYLLFFIVMALTFLTETFVWRQRGMLFFLTLYSLMIKTNRTEIKNR